MLFQPGIQPPLPPQAPDLGDAARHPACHPSSPGHRSRECTRLSPAACLPSFEQLSRSRSCHYPRVPAIAPRHSRECSPPARVARRFCRLPFALHPPIVPSRPDRKSTRLNSSHLVISYAVFCLKKKNIILQHLNYLVYPSHAVN